MAVLVVARGTKPLYASWGKTTEPSGKKLILGKYSHRPRSFWNTL